MNINLRVSNEVSFQSQASSSRPTLSSRCASGWLSKEKRDLSLSHVLPVMPPITLEALDISDADDWGKEGRDVFFLSYNPYLVFSFILLGLKVLFSCI